MIVKINDIKLHLHDKSFNSLLGDSPSSTAAAVEQYQFYSKQMDWRLKIAFDLN